MDVEVTPTAPVAAPRAAGCAGRSRRADAIEPVEAYAAPSPRSLRGSGQPPACEDPGSRAAFRPQAHSAARGEGWARTLRACGDRAREHEAKRMVLAPHDRLEMHDPERGLFCKHAAVDLDASYPLRQNLAVYLGPRRFMVELETMSPLRTLAPGSRRSHVETWTIVESF